LGSVLRYGKTCVVGLLALLTIVGCRGAVKEKSYVALRVIVVRHAEHYKKGAQDNIPAGKLGFLTPRGIEQAKATGNALAKRKVVQWLCSPTKRTRQTRDIIMSLNKSGGTRAEDESFATMSKGKLPDGTAPGWEWRKANWKKGTDPRPAGGESLKDATDRAVKRITAYAKEFRGQTVVIVTHTDICATLMGHAKGTPIAERFEKHKVATAEYFEIVVASGGTWSLVEER
jgi:broad specificity phosphatase PhoE